MNYPLKTLPDHQEMAYLALCLQQPPNAVVLLDQLHIHSLGWGTRGLVVSEGTATQQQLSGLSCSLNLADVPVPFVTSQKVQPQNRCFCAASESDLRREANHTRQVLSCTLSSDLFAQINRCRRYGLVVVFKTAWHGECRCK